jgi:hypothetical protein
MNTHPHPQRLAATRPRVRLQSLLHGQDGGHASPRRGERGEETIARHGQLGAVMDGQRGPDERMVLSERAPSELAAGPGRPR